MKHPGPNSHPRNSRGSYFERRMAEIAAEQRQPCPTSAPVAPSDSRGTASRPAATATRATAGRTPAADAQRGLAPRKPLDPLQALHLLQQRQTGGTARPLTQIAAPPGAQPMKGTYLRNRTPKPVDPLQALLGDRKAAPISLPVGTLLKSPCAKVWCRRVSALATHPGRRENGIKYLRSGAIRDLTLEAGCISSIVEGETLYEVRVNYPSLAHDFWQKIASEYLKRLDTQLDLLKGHLSDRILQPLWREDSALQPRLTDAHVSCTCPDPVAFCKHVIAVLYGAAVRLEDDPQLLLKFRGVEAQELIQVAQARFQLESAHPERVSRRLPVTTLAQLIDRELVGEPSSAAIAP
jgi:uncharacterized Zn finger protein